MFDNMFNGMFGKVAAGMCRITMNGGVAVKTSNGYKSYDIKKETLTNVTNFCFPMGDEFFFVIPTNKVAVGDIILVETPNEGKKPKCVIEAGKKIITVIDYETSEIRQIVPERHVFMGNTYFYGKIVSMLGNMMKNGKGMENIIKFSMMSSLMGGNSQGTNPMTSNGGMGQMMAMSMMMGGKDNMFSDMLSGVFSTDDSSDEPSLFDEDEEE